MSIYSGFATRQQEQTYDSCVESIIFILQKRLLKFYRNEKADENKFLSALCKIHAQMKSMENHKYLQPKTSHSFEELILQLKERQYQQTQTEGENNKKIENNEGSQAYPSAEKLKLLKIPRPDTGSNRIRTRNQSYNIGLTKQYPSQYKQMNQSKNLPKKSQLISSFSKGKNIDRSRQDLEKEQRIKLNANLTQNSKQHENEVRSILNNYIKKTKREYKKGIQRKEKEETDQK